MYKLKQKLSAICLAVTFLSSMTFSAMAAGTPNPKSDYMNNGAGIYNLVECSAGAQGESGTVIEKIPDTEVGLMIRATQGASSSAPKFTNYWTYTPKNNAKYLTFTYRYTGADDTATLSALFVGFGASVSSKVPVIGDGEWRVGVADFSKGIANSSNSNTHFAGYRNQYFSKPNQTPFESGNYFIYANDPLISDVSFDLAPSAGAVPVTEINDNSANYTVNYISWKDENGENVDVFESNKEYTVEISLTANDNYLFADKEWTLPGATSVDADLDSYVWKNTLTLTATYDTKKLMVDEISVEDGQTGVNPIGLIIDVKFNKKVDYTTVDETSIYMEPYTQLYLLPEDEYNMKVICVDTLELDTEYTLSFTDVIKTINGMDMEPYSVSFTTEDSFPTPTVTETVPGNEEINVSKSTTVRVEYDMQMDTDTITESAISISPEVPFSIEKYAMWFEIKFDRPLDLGTEYTLTLSDSIKSIYGANAEAKTIKFTTVPKVENLIINGFMENTDSMDMFSDANNNVSIRYVEEDGKNVIEWSVPWDTAPVIQYCSKMPYHKKWNVGHTYYIRAKVKASDTVNLYYDVHFQPDSGSAYHTVAEKSVGKDWTYLETTYSIGNSYVGDATDSIRIVSRKKDVKVRIADWEMYDMSLVESGNATISYAYPANYSEEIPLEDVEAVFEFDKPLLPSTINKQNITATGSVIDTIELDKNLSTLKLKFKKLEPNKTYTVNFMSGIKSLRGENITGESYEFSTYTVPNTALAIASSSISDGDENVKVSGLTMEVLFNTYPDKNTLNKDNITASENIIKDIVLDSENAKKAIIIFDDNIVKTDSSYTVTFSNGLKSIIGNPLEEKTISFKTKTKQNLIENFKEITNGSDAEAIKTFLKEDFSDVKKACDMVDYIVSKDDELLDKLSNVLLGTNADTEDKIYNTVSNAANFVIIDNASDAEDIKMLLESASLGLDENSAKTANELVSDKDSLYKYIMSVKYNNKDNIKEKTEKNIFLYALKKSNGWMNVKNVLHTNKNLFVGNDSIDTLLSNTDKLSTPMNVYSKLQNFEASDYSSVKKALENAYNEAIRNNNSGGSSSSGGGNGNGNGKNNSSGMAYTKPPKTENEPVIFNDLDSVEWAKNSILALYDRGVVNGRENGKFAPRDNVKREEFVKMLVGVAGCFDENAQTDFSDVSKDGWSYKYIASAVNNGLVNGISETQFGIGRNITREDAFTLVYRYLKTLDTEVEELKEIPNDEPIAEYAKEAIAFLNSIGIVSGDENGKFNPKSNLTRAEAAVLLNNLIKKI